MTITRDSLCPLCGVGKAFHELPGYPLADGYCSFIDCSLPVRLWEQIATLKDQLESLQPPVIASLGAVYPDDETMLT